MRDQRGSIRAIVFGRMEGVVLNVMDLAVVPSARSMTRLFLQSAALAMLRQWPSTTTITFEWVKPLPRLPIKLLGPLGIHIESRVETDRQLGDATAPPTQPMTYYHTLSLAA